MGEYTIMRMYEKKNDYLMIDLWDPVHMINIEMRRSIFRLSEDELKRIKYNLDKFRREYKRLDFWAARLEGV